MWHLAELQIFAPAHDAPGRPAHKIILVQVVGVFVRRDAEHASNLDIDQHVMDTAGRRGRTLKILTPQE